MPLSPHYLISLTLSFSSELSCNFKFYLGIYLLHVSPPDGEFHEDRDKAYFIYQYIVTTWYFGAKIFVEWVNKQRKKWMDTNTTHQVAREVLLIEQLLFDSFCAGCYPYITSFTASCRYRSWMSLLQKWGSWTSRRLWNFLEDTQLAAPGFKPSSVWLWVLCFSSLH